MYWKAACGNKVRVTGQLIDAESGAHIWADRFDRDLADIFAVQDELTQVIISALKVKLTPEKKDRLPRKGKISLSIRCLQHAMATSAELPKAGRPGRRSWELLRIFSIERRRRILPFRNPDDFEYRIEGMRKAGLPV